jgi:hypothetical protein
MPEVPLPESMGLNENAAISRDTKDSDKLLNGVKLTQPISGESHTAKDVTAVRCVKQCGQIGRNFDVLIFGS